MQSGSSETPLLAEESAHAELVGRPTEPADAPTPPPAPAPQPRRLIAHPSEMAIIVRFLRWACSSAAPRVDR
jgi:hypothetical protein